ncbi:putative O-methyltransferase YrrM [Cryobacterium mesophilum]|uniref:O-methyltransferase n=1 Tax=Terrimesophilobacter mesophilus TaxID=433647 RepID=A0A4R8VE20_9MICO|nr:O-methyltransferase [Terrimesophilobacter mesophilus]MBB5633356.1 putative O-methyltransferase YrrM [Terrimesophilobacter mesophilus]TFB80087.1 O-methyltransferase [Terrimesophilobacter mesophilus]
MNEEPWTDVDHFFTRLLVTPDDALTGALHANAEAGLPSIDVSPAQGKFLMLLVRLMNARRVLEIGTLGGYSTIWMARGLPEGGRLVTLEVVPKHAEVARSNLARAGVAERVEVRVAEAADSLAQLVREGADPFDLVFIDADKPNNAVYLEWALKLTRPGSVILCDNVVRGGRVLEEDGSDDSVTGTRAFLDAVGADPRLEATAIQTVGIKGWDGFALARVT